MHQKPDQEWEAEVVEKLVGVVEAGHQFRLVEYSFLGAPNQHQSGDRLVDHRQPPQYQKHRQRMHRQTNQHQKMWKQRKKWLVS
jgi:hypothetical protein